MIVVYGNKECLTCRILQVALKDSKLKYRFYYIGQDISVKELGDLHPALSRVPYILDDGKEISLVELEKKIWS